jgi:hypothetical protein
MKDHGGLAPVRRCGRWLPRATKKGQGIGVALWHLKIGSTLSNAIGFVLVTLGLLTLGGCISRLGREILRDHT